MTYGWNTKKNDNGSYEWQVTGFEYGAGSSVLRSGICATRAQAIGQAKRNVMPFRRAAR